MKIVYMGTPDFAAGALEALIDAGHEITAVVTQPDKAKGRSDRLLPPPVKVVAERCGIPVFQPEKIKAREAVDKLKEYPADVYIVAAFGQILSQEILDIPPYGCLNIHASLLPRYRGASPIQRVILEGEKYTGVTVMQMDAGLDTGAMLYQKETEISDMDTFETLHDKLMALGAEAIVEALPLLEAGELKPVPQRDEDSCYAPLIDKTMGELDFSRSALELDRQVRGLNPWPSAYTYFRGKRMKVWSAEPLPGEERARPGEILRVNRDSFEVACRESVLRIKEVQPEGKKRMSVHDFLLGAKPTAGEKLG